MTKREGMVLALAVGALAVGAAIYWWSSKKATTTLTGIWSPPPPVIGQPILVHAPIRPGVPQGMNAGDPVALVGTSVRTNATTGVFGQ